MINVLEFDSNLLQRKIGEVKVTNESLSQIETALKKVKDEGFEYVICKLQNPQIIQSMDLESLGFYLSDIGITWAIRPEIFSYEISHEADAAIRVATKSDIPTIKEIAKSRFLDSRFYSDPFFSKEDADKLYDTWVENSVKGEAADKVLIIHERGFITCKINSTDKGNIILIAVKRAYKGQSLGSMLIKGALKWFQTQRVDQVSVRTQLKNLNAMNFYNKLGFYIKEYDMIYAKII